MGFFQEQKITYFTTFKGVTKAEKIAIIGHMPKSLGFPFFTVIFWGWVFPYPLSYIQLIEFEDSSINSRFLKCLVSNFLQAGPPKQKKVPSVGANI